MKLIALVGFCSENFMWIRVSIPILTKFGTVMGLDLQTASAIKISNYKRKPAKKKLQFSRNFETLRCLCPSQSTDQGQILHARVKPLCMLSIWQFLFGLVHVFAYDWINPWTYRFDQICDFGRLDSCAQHRCQLRPIWNARVDQHSTLQCNIYQLHDRVTSNGLSALQIL